MNILILGSGAREHALSYYIASSPHTENLYIAPGNAGTTLAGTNIDIDPNDFDTIAATCKIRSIDMLVVGPEEPLVRGIVDKLRQDSELSGLRIVGPSAAAAQLEGSKSYAKEFMQKHGIPTAGYREYVKGESAQAIEYVQSLEPPIVIKADGLAAGKGVIIAQRHTEAEQTIRSMLEDAQFGAAGEKLIIEEFLDGIEMSCFALTDGQSYYLLPSAKDYKRIHEGDRGPNTGGMGAISPVPFIDDALGSKIIQNIVEPTISGLQKDQMQYIGFIFFGLICVEGEPYVIEYNCRLGDPETEVILARIDNDLVELLCDVTGDGIDPAKLAISPQHVSTVILASGGYPGAYEKGKVINGWDDLTAGIIFHAGTRLEQDQVVTNGGRVLALTGMADSLKEALQISYNNAEILTFDGKTYRKDIGHEFI